MRSRHLHALAMKSRHRMDILIILFMQKKRNNNKS